MSEIYFLGTTKPLAHTEYKFKDIIPDMDSGGMLYKDGIRFEENLWPDAVATGVRKILKGATYMPFKRLWGSITRCATSRLTARRPPPI